MMPRGASLRSSRPSRAGSTPGLETCLSHPFVERHVPRDAELGAGVPDPDHRLARRRRTEARRGNRSRETGGHAPYAETKSNGAGPSPSVAGSSHTRTLAGEMRDDDRVRRLPHAAPGNAPGTGSATDGHERGDRRVVTPVEVEGTGLEDAQGVVCADRERLSSVPKVRSDCPRSDLGRSARRLPA